MNWNIVTCDHTRYIVPAQMHLIEKYLPGITVRYIDLKEEKGPTWTLSVSSRLPDDEYIVFGLDDYLPIHPIDQDRMDKAIQIVKDNNLDRFELGWGASKKSSWIHTEQQKFIDQGDWLLYGIKTPYQVSCQFSIWKTSSLKKVLSRIMSPWHFETKGRISAAGCFSSENCVLRWIEESALSGRRPGKINVLGLRHKDVDELVEAKLLERKDLIYGWKNSDVFTPDLPGRKYGLFYE